MSESPSHDLWPSVQYRYATQYKDAGWEHMPIQLAWTDLPWLMREVERLRAENAALREIVEAVATSEGRYFIEGEDACLYCGTRTGPLFTGLEDDTLDHAPYCPVTKARALLATPNSAGTPTESGDAR